jgi:hypothetical protein
MAGGAIDFHEIAMPETLNSTRYNGSSLSKRAASLFFANQYMYRREIAVVGVKARVSCVDA